MPEQVKKAPCNIALLAHVSASRREPHLNSLIPGPKTGAFSCPAEVKRFQGLKIPPYIVVLQEQKPQHMVVDFRDSALQPFSEQETRYDENISVGYKGEFLITQPSASGNRCRYGSGCTGRRSSFRFSYAGWPYVPAGKPYRSPRSCPIFCRSDRCGSAPYLHPWQAGTAAYIPWGSASVLHR